MTDQGNVERLASGKLPGRHLFRWECHCQRSPVLLATYDSNGRVNIKARDRYWHIQGTVQTTCPRCGSEHMLDPRHEARRREEADRERKRWGDGQ